VTAIQDIIREHNIELVILDSQMAGSDYGPDIGQNATRYYNAVRQLGVASLVIDHVPKSAITASHDNSNSSTPIGSVVKSNRARQAYELTKHQEPGQGFTDLVLNHTKNNEGRLWEPFGIKIEWVDNEQTGHLDRTLFTTFEVEGHPVHSTRQPMWKRICGCVDEGPLTTKELAALLDTTDGNIRSVLNQNKDKFVKLDGDRWGRLARL